MKGRGQGQAAGWCQVQWHGAVPGQGPSEGVASRSSGTTAKRVFVARRSVPYGGVEQIQKYVVDNEDQISLYWKRKVHMQKSREQE